MAIQRGVSLEGLASSITSFGPDMLPDDVPLEAVLRPRERILFSEVGWDHPSYFSALIRLRGKCPFVVFGYLVHDLIAIKFPHFFELDFGARVREFLRALPQVCDLYVCVSNSTAHDVRELLDPFAETAVVKLGCDVADVREGKMESAGAGYVLCTATMEVRKNHLLLYFVWRNLAQELGQACPKLLLIGRPGWLAGDVLHLFAHDPILEGLVEIRSGVSDDRMVSFIKGSLFTVFPSFYEGVGLPVCESYFHKKVCVTSNTSSLPEINPFPELMFDPYDYQQAFQIIRSLVITPTLVSQYEAKIPSVFFHQTWSQCVDELVAIMSR
ncbi:glycosyltransferase [Pandoraea sp. SD6-2]|uniref:glycosyltransferase n=1 Tax=Pandoraea sp. SD6-2 TaxID=1286093 RepID=UPI000399D3D6|nr:glycosyltransferase [Pandoraea sp. SD6-2]